MKMMIKSQNVFKKLALASAAAGLLTLSSCGGGDSTPDSKTRSGILTDSPIKGVSYLTSTGVSGVTATDGSYNFNVGDTVEFKLGALVLGNVTATGIVTPIELAAGNSNRLTNLLVMLQSLDVDGNPANGISIPAAAAAAVTTAIDLTVTPASFNTGALQTAMTAGSITASIVTEAAAGAAFLAQGMTLLSSNIWVRPPTANTAAGYFLRFAANGDYLHGSTRGAGGEGMPGVEQGNLSLPSFDANGYKLAPSVVVDTNGQRGPSHPGPCERIRSVGDQVIFANGTTTDGGVTCTETTRSKVENNPGGIVGVWALGSATTIKTVHIAFFSNGKFLTVDPEGSASCGGPGVESGTYTYSGNTLTVSNFVVDTNGCAGLSSGDVVEGFVNYFTISPDGATAALKFADEGTFPFYRVSK